MINFKTFKINSDLSEINIEFTKSPDDIIQSIAMWDILNFENPSDVIDISYKLTGDNTESFIVYAKEFEKNSFENNYIIKVVTDKDEYLTYDFIKDDYVKCINSKLQNTIQDNCIDCKFKIQNEVMESLLILELIIINLNNNEYPIAQYLIKTLNILCNFNKVIRTTNCKTCNNE